MPSIFLRLRILGWAVVEAALLLVVLCMLLDIIIGPQADSYIPQVSHNATAFLNAVPPDTAVGFALVVAVYGLFMTRLRH
ncbi:MAG TPA: hypothetical protein VHW66_20480 [Stellaceae bacterium]|jgi:hypothetical protein|nr:hypothetical protein [Stellaceae bacterium]